MERTSTKERTLRKTMLQKTLTVFAGVCLLAASTMLSQNRGALKVKVPFQFSVKDVQLPAGEYAIEKWAGGGVLLTSKDGAIRKVILATPAESPTTRAKTRVLFRRYGSDYFLSQVWVGSEGWGFEIPVSKVERDVIARNQQAREMERVAVSAQ